MSAYVVSKAHIDVLLHAALAPVHGSALGWFHDGKWRYIDYESASDVGAMLWTENVRSVGYRYSFEGREGIYGEGWHTPDQELHGTYINETVVPGTEPIATAEWWSEYRYRRPRRERTPVEALRALDCFEYQACEHDGWKTGEACAFCAHLRKHTITRLSGYWEAEWEVKVA